MKRGRCFAELQLAKYAHPRHRFPLVFLFVLGLTTYAMVPPSNSDIYGYFTHFVQGASYRSHFELAIFLWQHFSRSGDAAPAAEIQYEIVSSLERCLQLHPSYADALKALALFHCDIRHDNDAAVRPLEKLAQVIVLPSNCCGLSCRQRFISCNTSNVVCRFRNIRHGRWSG